MGHEKLVEALSAETAQKAKEIIEEARKKADLFLKSSGESFREQIKQNQENVLNEIRAEKSLEKNSILASYRGQLNFMKYSFMQQTINESVEEIKKNHKEKYQKILFALLDKLSEDSKNYGQGIFYGAKETMDLVKNYAAENNINLVEGDIPDGFLFMTNDKKVILRSSMQTVLESLRSILEVQIKEILFGGL